MEWVARRDGRGSAVASSVIAAQRATPPRWYAHSFNRVGLYRLAATLGWLPRPARLALARRVGRLAPRLMPVEQAAVRATLARVLGTAEPWRVDALTVRTFADFAMCFSD